MNELAIDTTSADLRGINRYPTVAAVLDDIERTTVAITAERDQLREQYESAMDELGAARGEALVMRRTLEWLRYKCTDLDIGLCVACNTLDYLGYDNPTDDCELADIYDERSGHGTVGVGGKAK